MASITKRKSQGGRYYIRWYENGKVKWKSTGEKSKEKAQDYYDKWKKNKGELFSRDFYVHELFEKRLEYMKLHYSNGTYNIYKSTFKFYMQIHKNTNIGKVLPDDLERYKRERKLIPDDINNISGRRKKEISNSTINIEIRVLKATFQYACKLKILSENPFRYVDQFEIEEHKIVYIPDHHIKLILDHTQDTLIKDVFLHALRTACRLGEIINLRYRDVDLQEKTIQILQTKTKTPRNLPLSDQLYAQLYKYFYDENGNSRLYNPDDYIYKVTGELCSKKFKKIIRKLKLPESYKFHSLRHTAITNLLRNSGNVRIAQFVAGHKSLKTTQGYLHNISEEVRAAVNTL